MRSDDPELTERFVSRLAADLQDSISLSFRPRSVSSGGPCGGGRTTSWLGIEDGPTNGPTEAVNNLIKRVKRITFGFRRFRSFRIRALLYAGNPNWDLLATVTPR